MNIWNKTEKGRFVLVGVAALLFAVLLGWSFGGNQSEAAAENETESAKKIKACLKEGSMIHVDSLQIKLSAELIEEQIGNVKRLSVRLAVIQIDNVAEISAEYAEGVDQDPPVISGVSDKQVTIWDTISYRSGVTAWDEKDGQVNVTVDSSKVNLNAVGSYPITYIAVDKAGNRATATATIEVRDISQERVKQIADELLAQITTPQMSDKEKCRAIYDWAQNSIKYVVSADMSDIYHGAYEGFTKRRGDCYTYYAVATVLFNQLGIPNMKVERAGGTSEHYWCLVNVGEGWYHFDCSPRRAGHYVDTCLVPDSVLERYSTEEIEGYYDFDHSLYPERGQ